MAMKREVEGRTAELLAARQEVPEHFPQTNDLDRSGLHRLPPE
jgi:hypothetical protein